MPVKDKTVEALHDPVQFKKCLGMEKYYPDYLIFFKKEMQDKGWQNVVNEYLFKGDERAEDLLVRLYASKSFSCVVLKSTMLIKASRFPAPVDTPRLRHRISTTSYHSRSTRSSLLPRFMDRKFSPSGRGACHQQPIQVSSGSPRRDSCRQRT